MAIEIIGRATNPTPIRTPQKTGTDGEKPLAAASTEKTDSVALTSTSQEIKKAFGSSSGSPVNADRVSSVKKALADGSYRVNAEKVAQKLIQFEALMPRGNNS